MDPQHRDAFSDDLKAQLFAAAGLTPDGFDDLNGFENFVYGNADRVVRITHHGHRDPDLLMGELEFIDHLHREGGAVCKPLPVDGERLLASVGDFSVCQFERARGRPIGEEDWQTDVWRAWGEAIGGFHAALSTFRPAYDRPDWRSDPNHQFVERLPVGETRILERANTLMASLEELPQTQTNYGLIHGDAHPGNFVIDDGKLTFFDFDDAIYTWLAYDIATIAFTVVLMKHVPVDDAARSEAVKQFMPVFLEGYASRHTVDDTLLKSLAPLMKLREFSLYAVIHSHLDVESLDPESDWYPLKFLDGRKVRLEEDVPFIDLDLTRL